MQTYDPRTISSQVYSVLNTLKESSTEPNWKEQKSQAVELYSYLSAWGLLRLKAEEFSLSNQPNKQKVVECFFNTLSAIASPDKPKQYRGKEGLKVLGDINRLGASAYLGLTGIALQIAREFAFWAEAIYPKDAPPENNTPSAPGGNE